MKEIYESVTITTEDRISRSSENSDCLHTPVSSGFMFFILLVFSQTAMVNLSRLHYDGG